MKADMQYFVRVKDIPWKVVEKKQGILLKLEDGNYYGINEIGIRIWELLDGKSDTENIISSICREFGVNKKKASSDVQRFLKELEKEGLIEKIEI